MTVETEPLDLVKTLSLSEGKNECDNGRAPADHLRLLPGSRWALWNWIGLRGSGFPFENVFKLSGPECAAAADEVAAAEALAGECWPDAIEEVRSQLRKSEPKTRRELSRRLKILKKGKPPDLDTGLPKAGPFLAAFVNATRALDRSWARYVDSHQRSIESDSRVIREIVRSDRFREALIWQNRRALVRLTKRLQDGAATEDGRRRRDLDLVALYWQRYCTKNDSIGSFGPVGWARFSDSDAVIIARPGRRLVAKRTVYFETWCIEALAGVLSAEREVREWIAPRLIADIQIDGNSAYRGFGERLQLTEREASVLSLCSGKRPARDIAQLLIDASDNDIACQDEVFEVLESLAGKAIISWRFLLSGSWLPELELRDLLAAIGDSAIRRRALAKLDELEEARNAIALAAGDVNSLDRLMAALEDEFTAVVGAAPVRAEGKMYAGRTLVYEDCQRDFSLELGSDLLKAISRPLVLLLTSARWLSFQMAEKAREICEDAYSQLARDAGSRPVDLSGLLSLVRAWQLAGRIDPAGDCRRMHENQWASILDIDWEKHSVSYRSDELGPVVASRFRAPNSGWQSARYHCPDLMIAASSVEAIRRGDFQLVLGELHLGRNTLNTCLFVSQHPCADELRNAIETDLPDPQVVASYPSGAITSRGRPALQLEKDFMLEFPGAPAAPDRQSLPIGSLVVERVGESLSARVPNGGPSFGLVEMLAGLLSEEIVNCFGMPAPGNHRPRVTIEGLVVCRESWTLHPSAIEFANDKDAVYRFVAARRWANELGMPRFVFYRVPGEKKPCFLDWESRIYVSLFANAVQRAAEKLSLGTSETHPPSVIISEMLPAPDQLWLTDAEGARYTSELRIVALDLSA